MNQEIQVEFDLEHLRQQHVMIAMPCYGGQMTESTFMSFIRWSNTARQLGINWTVETLINESLISRARNTLTARFLQNTQATHLMFIDADIGWEPPHLLLLLQADVDVIGGLYPMKSLPIKWCVNGVDGGQQQGPVQEVSKTGTGFMLIKRSVFEALNSHPAVKPFANDLGLPPALDPFMKTYFDTAVRDGRYYSEDWTFCENWRDLGGQVWVDRRILLKHTGTYTFDAQAQQQLWQDLQAVHGQVPPTAPVPEVQARILAQSKTK